MLASGPQVSDAKQFQSEAEAEDAFLFLWAKCKLFVVKDVRLSITPENFMEIDCV